ncbi:hypothetical protein ASE99_02785 [Serratia sp. Leaf51]|nr:hypothetical protein ASE99_02785 [Serratia sp. Leaf51]
MTYSLCKHSVKKSKIETIVIIIPGEINTRGHMLFFEHGRGKAHEKILPVVSAPRIQGAIKENGALKAP